MKEKNLKITYVPVGVLRPSEFNPRKWTKDQLEQVKQSIKKFQVVDPLLVNSAQGRHNILIGGHLRWHACKELGIKEVPVVYLHIPDIASERELNIRLNKNHGEFDLDLLSKFDPSLLSRFGFTSEEIDEIFPADENPEVFDLQKELRKLHIEKVTMKKGQVFELGKHRMMVGDSTIEADVLRLMDGEKAHLCLTDPPYQISYLKGKKRRGAPTVGFGYKRDRRYLETESLPDNFTELWMANVAKIQQENFSIICYETWRNLRQVWNEMEKYWKVKNMIVWHLPNRVQGFAARYQFFNKHDIAMVAVSEKHASSLNLTEEPELLENEYRTALYGISGHPTWEGYRRGKLYAPTDFIEYRASDEKSSGQGIIFGTKPVEILIPYVKVLTQRDDLVLEPFGGSGSTLIACEKLHRRCYLMEKSPVYAEVIRRRWEVLTGQRAKLLT